MAEVSRAKQLRRDLGRVYADAVAFSVMVGAGETYLAAFVLALGMGEVTSGLIASIPMLAGGIIQLVSPMAVRALRSHRKWVVMCAVIQALSFLPMIAGAIHGSLPKNVVFLLASLYWGFGLATGPAWNTWVGTLVPRRLRAHYFARRSRAAHFAVLCGLVFAGITLEYGKAQGAALTAFALIFSVASMCRFISSALLAGQSEPEPPDEDHREVPVRELLSRLKHGHDGRLLVYMLATQAAVQISGPYFTPYMLGELKMSYASYLLLIATSYSARIAVLPALGGLVRRVGARRVLWFSGLGLIPLSALWLMSDTIVYLLFVQFVAGAVWAAWELATFLLLFETIPEEERTSVLTTFNFAHALATVGGSAIGATLLKLMGSDVGGYMTIFALSGGVRILTIALLARAARVLPTPPVPEAPVPVPTRVLAVRPNLGAIEKPILPAFPRAPQDTRPRQ